MMLIEEVYLDYRFTLAFLRSGLDAFAFGCKSKVSIAHDINFLFSNVIFFRQTEKLGHAH